MGGGGGAAAGETGGERDRYCRQCLFIMLMQCMYQRVCVCVPVCMQVCV